MPPCHALLHLPPRAPAEPLARAWLAAQWGVDAQALPLARDTRGRPRLAGTMAHRDANWSHSGEHLLVACGEAMHIGCDLERIRPRPNARALAGRFFHPNEAAWLDGLPDAEAEAAFLRLWCAKEAVLKAHGHGISFGLHRFRLADGGGGGEGKGDDGLRIVECDPRLGDAAAWRLHEFRPVAGYLGAIAWHPLDETMGCAAIIPA